VKPAKLGGVQHELAAAGEMSGAIDAYKKSHKIAHEALPKNIREGLDSVQSLLRAIDPVEATRFSTTIQQAIVKQGTFTAGRVGAGQRGALGGLAGMLGIDALRKFANPEYRALVKRAVDKGDQAAIEGLVRSLSFGAASFLRSPFEGMNEGGGL
jgi:hypothetical protein